jgi:hypothetical protein
MGARSHFIATVYARYQIVLSTGPETRLLRFKVERRERTPPFLFERDGVFG